MITRTPVRGQAVRFTGEMALFRALAPDTGGAFTLLEFRVAPGYGASPHRDHSFDEAFFVLQGTFIVQVGEDEHHLSPGDFAFAPKLTPHAFRNTGMDEGRVLILTLPGGYQDRFFAEIGEPVSDPEGPLTNDPGDRATVLAAAQRYGIEVLSPIVSMP